MDIIKEMREKILRNSEEKYKKFSASQIPGTKNIAGVRLPTLRKIAKEIYSSDYHTFLGNINCQYHEEIMLKGMVIGLIKKSPENILTYVEKFIPEINNWAVCDTFCCGLKFVNNNKSLVWEFLQTYLYSDKEYEIRFAVVVLLNFYITEDYIDRVLDIFDNIKTDDYYAQMAVAWAISVCFVKFEAKTFDYLKNSNIDKFTFNKSIQKIIESYRVDNDTKFKMKFMRK